MVKYCSGSGHFPKVTPPVVVKWDIDSILKIEGLVSRSEDPNQQPNIDINGDFIVEVKFTYEKHWAKVRYISHTVAGDDDIVYLHTSSFSTSAYHPDIEYRVFESKELYNEI